MLLPCEQLEVAVKLPAALMKSRRPSSPASLLERGHSVGVTVIRSLQMGNAVLFFFSVFFSSTDVTANKVSSKSPLVLQRCEQSENPPDTADMIKFS